MIGAVLALVLPALLAGGGDGRATVTLAVLAVALVALARLGGDFGVLVGRTVATAHLAVRQPSPVLAGRVTDPVHHPLRPRAPGSA